MRTATAQARNGIQWTPWLQLDDLDFADDLALLSHTHRQMQEKTNSVKDSSAQIGLHINRRKTKVLRINATIIEAVHLDEDLLEEVNSFTYLGSVVDSQGGTEADVKARIGKARAVFLQLKNVWSSKDLTLQTKIKIFNINVKPVRLYGSETWRTSGNYKEGADLYQLMSTKNLAGTLANHHQQRRPMAKNKPEACRC